MRDRASGPPRLGLAEASSVAANMSARDHVACRAIIALLLVQLSNTEESCPQDGLFADYESNCQQYVKCVGGVVTGRYSCPAGRAFSEAAGACRPARGQPCARRACRPGDTRAYAAPGAACRRYYRCRNGTAAEHACPSGAWFDFERQACTRGAGTCFEPLCVGLPDGQFPDPSHNCQRTLTCLGAELTAVTSCDGSCEENCPPPRSASVPLPAGDADFCSDENCLSLCQEVDDGAYPDRTAGCREYFVCEDRRVTRRGVCEPGQLFADGQCTSKAVSCPPAAHSPCYNRADGLFRDWKDCASWFECRRERVISRGSCEPGRVFDGTTCVARDTFLCVGPTPAVECEGLPIGTYQDLSSNCSRYFHCEGRSRTLLECGVGEMFDGSKCVPARSYLCPSLDRDSCAGRVDGRYRAANAGCRGYYGCAKGERALYACPKGQAFDGVSCVRATLDLCINDDYSCYGLKDGYHAELETNCHRYFYCQAGDRLATLTCLGGKIFDGRACVDPAVHECGAPSRNSIENGGKHCERDGFFVRQGTECKRYYFCVDGIRTYLSCHDNMIFNGQICVHQHQYSCPG